MEDTKIRKIIIVCFLEERLKKIAEKNPSKVVTPDIIDTFTLSALAPSTQKAYQKEFEKFNEWKSSLTLGQNGATDSELLPLYLMTVAGSSKAKAAVITSAMSFFSKKSDREDPSFSPYNKLVMKAIGNRTPAVKHKEQVSLEEMKLFYPLANSTELKEKRIGTLAVILFAGFFRPMELLELKRSEVFLTPAHARLMLKKSKRNQNGSPEPVFISRTSSKFCPVEILENWLKASPSSLFLLPSLSGPDRAWSYNAALKEMKETTSKLGINRNITLHSFRGSAATAAIEMGCTGEELDRACRWKSSNSKNSYVQNSEKTTKNASSLLSKI